MIITGRGEGGRQEGKGKGTRPTSFSHGLAIPTNLRSVYNFT